MSLVNLSARDAARHIREGDITAESYITALLRHHERIAHLNTLITIRPPDVLEQARAVDRARGRGEVLGPLAGVPFVAKDQIDASGYPTTLGTSALKNYVARTDADVVGSLFRNGAILLGKANLHELAAGGTSSNPTFGSVRNPYDPARIPGGSRGGTAAALAARIVPLGLGEDRRELAAASAWRTPLFDGRYLSPHGVDLPFVWDNIANAADLVGSDSNLQAIADRVSSRWLAFARTGEPNASGLVTWKPYTASERDTLIIDQSDRLVRDPHRAERLALESIPSSVIPRTFSALRPSSASRS